MPRNQQEFLHGMKPSKKILDIVCAQPEWSTLGVDVMGRIPANVLGAGGAKTPKTSLCPLNQPPHSGFFSKFHFLPPKKRFLMWVGGLAAADQCPK